MKKFLPLSLIIIITLVSSSCSYFINFVVINESGSDLKVEYTFESYISTPSKMSLAEWNKWFGERKWHEMPQAEYQFEADTRKFTVKIAPNEAVKILSAHDGIYFVKDANFQIIKIKISGNNGTVVYEGKELFKQFEEKNYTNRFITYK